MTMTMQSAAVEWDGYILPMTMTMHLATVEWDGYILPMTVINQQQHYSHNVDRSLK
jgi:hypothetical protein